MGERIGRDGRGRGPKGGNDECVNDLNSQGNDQGLGANGNVNGVNGNVEGVYRDVGGAPDFSTIIAQQLQNLLPTILAQHMSGCSIDQKVKYIASSFVEEFCPSHEMQKLETKLWNHVIVGAGHAAYTDRFHELDRLVPHLVTPKSRKIERYVYGLAPQIHKMVEATEPKTIQKAVKREYGLLGLSVHYNFFYATGGLCAHASKLINAPVSFARDCRVVLRRILGERPEDKVRLLMSAKASDKKQEEIFVVRHFLESSNHLAPSELEELSGQLKELQKKSFIRPSSSP
ncbi:hypothetical protein Tco_1225707 [Tanacetum coccineum]